MPDSKHARLRQIAKHHDISVNKLFEELTDKLDAAFSLPQPPA